MAKALKPATIIVTDFNWDGKSEAKGEDRHLWIEEEFGNFILIVDWGYRADKSLSPEVRHAATPMLNADYPVGKWNRFEISANDNKVTVVLNGKTVIKEAVLPGVSQKGKIALQHHGDPIQFAIIYIKELD